MITPASLYIKTLSPEIEEQINRNPSFGIEAFILPSPFTTDDTMKKNYSQSYFWEEEREVLGIIEIFSNPDADYFYIRKQVTSPFGRGKGIGSALLEHFLSQIPDTALVETSVWERQDESLDFFKKRGFKEGERISWQALTFVRLSGRVQDIREALKQIQTVTGTAEELGKIRHDAKKAIRLIADMAGALSAENCRRIIEDINRETTALINTLNQFRDSVQRFRTVNLKDLVIDRIIPMVEHSPVSCELNVRLAPYVSEAHGHYVSVARALVNLVSNALDAIREANRPGALSISIWEDSNRIFLSIEDNGVGIAADRLQLGPEGFPKFVGITTKLQTGEGQGTKQIYATFGQENIHVTSTYGQGTKWQLSLPRAEEREEAVLLALEKRLREMLAKVATAAGDTETELKEAVKNNRSLDILLWDIILQFSHKNNVRELYRDVLAYRYGTKEFSTLQEELVNYRTDSAELRVWLLEAVEALKKSDATIAKATGQNQVEQEHLNYGQYAGQLFRAYSQTERRTVIFTLNPATGAFGATDRKLAEHADFVVYLKAPKDTLLRGEFFGELQNPTNPVQLGVWEIASAADGQKKAALVRSGARRLIEMGIPKEKHLLFYEATWRHAGIDLNVNRPWTLESVANLNDDKLDTLLMQIDDEFSAYLMVD